MLSLGDLLQTLADPCPGSQQGVFFGNAVATDGNLTVVGAYGADVQGYTKAGCAYVFNSATGALVATLANPAPADNDCFGFSVAISGNTVVVGTCYDDTGVTDAGAAYLFDVPTGSLLHTLANPTPAAHDCFGCSVAISGNTVVVGTCYDDTGVTDAGAAYLFDVPTGSLLHTLANPTPAAHDCFGYSVAISGNTVIVGAYKDDLTATDTGTAYLFDATTGSLLYTLANPTPAKSDCFGYSVGISGNTVIVGAYYDYTGGPRPGAVYFFDATTGSLLRTLTNPVPSAGDYFGFSVAISGNTVVVGALFHYAGASCAGVAYLFDATTGSLLYTLANPTPAENDFFGCSVAISGNIVIVGARGDDTGAIDRGAAYLFDRGAAANRAPTDITLSGCSIPENSSTGTVVGGLSTADPDMGDTFAYTLPDSAGGRFKIVGSQLQVDNGTLLDYELCMSHNVTVRTTDAGGLTFDKSFTITVTDDNEQPLIVSLIPNVTSVMDASVGNATFWLTVVYNEAMDTSVAPTISFPAENPGDTLTLNTSMSDWSNNTTYVARYNVADAGVMLANIDVRVTGAMDLAGNTQTQADFADNFGIDTQNPSVSSVTPNLTTIADANAGTATFSFTVVYNEAMNTSWAPTIAFPVENPSSTLTLDPGVSGWSNSTTYVARYNVTDANVALANVDVRVTGAKDTAGNVQSQGSFADKFSIDMRNPTVTSLTPNLTTILDANVGTATFSLTVVYSEAMNTTVTPTVTFPVEDPTGMLTFNAGKSGWTNSTTYVAKYNVTDANVALANVDVRVTGAMDAVGNTQTQTDFADKFNIDMRNPTVISVTPNLTTVTEANVGTAPFWLTVVYSEAMNTTIAPNIATDIATAAILFNAGASGWSNATTYVAKYDVSLANVTAADIDVGAAGAQNAAGNTQVVADFADQFSIDIQAPTIDVQQIADIAAGAGSSLPSYLTNVGGTLFFVAHDGVHDGDGLWKSDGTNAAAILVKNVQPITCRTRPAHLTNVGGTLFFTANDGTNGVELWRSDGTMGGTVLVKDIDPGDGSSDPRWLTNVGGILYFACNDGTGGSEIWKSDGTEAGTVLVKNIQQSTLSSPPSYLTNVGGTLYFAANDDGNGRELWKSDGTEAGTTVVKDINPGTAGSYPRCLTNMGGVLYFSGGVSNALQLWKSDGTEAGTVLVKDVVINSSFASVDDTLFFAANDGTNGVELWKSDGTQPGTVLVKDIAAGAGSSAPSRITNVGGTLFFQAYDVANGTELWKSDGTQAGTVLVKDIASGVVGSEPSYLTNVGGTLFFQVYGVKGAELWRSDGTQAGTALAADISATLISMPYGLANANGSLFFVAWDDTRGVELWRLSPSATVSSVTPNPTTLADANAGAATFSLTVTYGQVMDTAITPTIAFPVENPTSTVTLNTTASGWSNDTTYVAVYDVTDADVALADIDVRVTGAKDTIGITQTQADFADAFSIDTQNPTVTINQASSQVDPTGASPINFTVVFSKAVSDFTDVDVTLSGTAGATTAVVTGSGATYNVAVSGMTGDGTAIAAITAGVASDAAGNGNEASTSTDNTTTYDGTPPLLSDWTLADDTGVSPTDRLTNDSTPVLTFTFSEVVYGQDADVSILDPTSASVSAYLVAGWGTNTLRRCKTINYRIQALLFGWIS